MAASATPAAAQPAAARTVIVVAKEPWNDSGFDVTAGELLEFAATGAWTDATIATDPDGYEKGYMKPFGWLRRDAKAQWFALIGCVGKSRDHCFVVGKHAALPAPASGRLYFFANDVPGFYWNNHGQVQVSIKTAPRP